MKIHQILPTISPFDAIGNYVFYLQNLFQKLGYTSDVYAQNIHPDCVNAVKSFDKCNPQSSDFLIYHHSTKCDFIDHLKKLQCKKIMIYHNITPANFFKNMNPVIENLAIQGREQLKIFSTMFDSFIGVSKYNTKELELLGFKNTHTIPLLSDFSVFNQPKNQKILSKFSNSKNILYVGRIAPNKKVDELIKAFLYYNINIEKNSNLIIVGNYKGHSENYFKYIQTIIKKSNAKNIHIIENISSVDLISYYTLADLIITLSNHEGFCVPIIEAMFFQKPIIAKNLTAIPLTLGEGGILINDETFEEIGELIDHILNNQELCAQIIAKQSLQLKKLYHKKHEEFAQDILNSIT